jgi:amidase
MSEFAFLSATELARRVADRSVSATELLESFLARLDRFNPTLNAVIVDVRDAARADARRADAAVANGQQLGPFQGVPTTIKESFNLTGTPTTWGNPAWRTNIARGDALAVQKIRNAGAVVFGKTNVPLMLADFQSYNDIYGTTNNPYDPARTPGGSSGGSAAALAAGLSALELGSDIGGSIRNPAHFCGVFGHKPTWNLLSAKGHTGPQESFAGADISVIGPLARSAADLDTAVRLLAGPDAIVARGYRLALPELPANGVRGMRVAVWRDDAACPVSAEVRARVDQVARMLRDRGATVDMDARPDFSADHTHTTYQQLLQATLASRLPDAEYESLQQQVAALGPEDDSDRARVLRAQVSTFRDWTTHNELRHRLRWSWHAFFDRYDLLVTPIMPTSAFPHDHRRFGERTIRIDDREYPYFQQVFWAGLSGVAYLPSTVIPTGLDAAGLPIGVQLVGPEYGDLVTIGVARALEADGCRFVPPPDYR